MAAMSPACADEFRSDLVLIQKAVQSGVTVQRASAQERHYERWVEFCVNDLRMDPDLSQLEDPIPVLQVFALRYRDGRLAPSNRSVKSRTVEDALRAVAQKHSLLGAPDPRFNVHGKIDVRLSRLLRSYTLADAPPVRVKPVPVTIVMQALRAAHRLPTTPRTVVTADILTVAFFYLLRPGEYAGTTHAEQPFLIRDVLLHLGTRQLDPYASPLHEIQAATAASYTLTHQKNGVGNETISHGRSSHELCCPVRASIRLLLYHRQHQTAIDKPIASYYSSPTRLVRITAKDVSTCLTTAATILQPSTGINPAELTARSLRAGGAMALLCANVDFDSIKLVGRWKSDTMVKYLHAQAQPIMQRLSARMFNNGQYSFLPTELVPAAPA